MKRILTFSFFILFLSSCGSFQLTEHYQLSSNETLLPSLHPIYKHYEGIFETNLYDGEYENSEEVFSVSNPFNDPFLEGLYKKEVWTGFTKAGSKDFGYAVITENYLNVNNNFVWGVIGLTFGLIPNLLGLPINIQEVEIEYVIEIIDANQKLLGRYIGSGYEKKTFNLYNYGTAGNDRLLKLAAFNQAMDSIKGQISKDSQYLSSKLLLAGPIN